MSTIEHILIQYTNKEEIEASIQKTINEVVVSSFLKLVEDPIASVRYQAIHSIKRYAKKNPVIPSQIFNQVIPALLKSIKDISFGLKRWFLWFLDRCTVMYLPSWVQKEPCCTSSIFMTSIWILLFLKVVDNPPCCQTMRQRFLRRTVDIWRNMPSVYSPSCRPIRMMKVIYKQWCAFVCLFDLHFVNYNCDLDTCCFVQTKHPRSWKSKKETISSAYTTKRNK